jgi:hypothetical protein
LNCAALFWVMLYSMDFSLSPAGRVSRLTEMARDYGRNAQQIVSYRDISNRA